MWVKFELLILKIVSILEEKMKDKVIIILVCIAVYSIIGIVSMISLQSITALLRLQDVGADIIGWFIYIGSVPHGLRFVYATYIEKYRKQSMAKTQNVVVFGALLAFACLFSFAFIDYKSQIGLLSIITFVSNTALTFSDIALGGLAIDRFGYKLRAYLNGARVIFSALGPMISGWMFFHILETYNAKRAIFSVLAVVVIIALPIFFLSKAKADFKANSNKPSLKIFFKQTYLRNFFFLLLFAQTSTALHLFIGGTFLVDKGLSATEIGMVFGVYSVIASVLGGVVGARINAWLGANKVFIIVLGLEALSFAVFFYLSIEDVEKIVVILVSCISSFIINIKFVSLYTLAMQVSKSAQSGVNFSIMTSGIEILPAILAIVGGYIVKILGWNYLFSICFILGFLSFLIFIKTRRNF